MILVDTSIWIEFFRLKEPVVSELQEHIESGNVIVHSLVFAELLQGCKKPAEVEFILEYWDSLKDDQSSYGIVEGGRFSFDNKMYSKGMGLVDAVLISEARRRKARIWTLDLKMRAFLARTERH